MSGRDSCNACTAALHRRRGVLTGVWGWCRSHPSWDMRHSSSRATLTDPTPAAALLRVLQMANNWACCGCKAPLLAAWRHAACRPCPRTRARARRRRRRQQMGGRTRPSPAQSQHKQPFSNTEACPASGNPTQVSQRSQADQLTRALPTLEIGGRRRFTHHRANREASSKATTSVAATTASTSCTPRGKLCR